MQQSAQLTIGHHLLLLARYGQGFHRLSTRPHKFPQLLLPGLQWLIGGQFHQGRHLRQCIGIQTVGLGHLAHSLGQPASPQRVGTDHRMTGVVQEVQY